MNISNRFLLGALLLSSVVLLHCGGCSDSSGDDGPGGSIDVGGPPKVFAPPPSVDDVGEDAAPQPVLSLAIRGSVEPTLGLGWPWLVRALVLHPSALGTPSTTASFALPGDEAFTLVLVDPAGKPVAAAFERIGAPLAPTTLQPGSAPLQLDWRLPTTAAASLSAGTYTLVLSLQTGGKTVKSPPVTVTLTATPDAGAQTGPLVAADEAAARGDLAAAEAAVDAVLAAQPNHVQALARKGELRERQGDLAGAYGQFNAAINAAVKAEPNAPEGGPRHLYLRRDLLAEQLDGGGY